MRRNLSRFSKGSLVALLLVSHANAYELYKTARTELNADLDVAFGLFHSQESYAQARDSSGSQGWQEGFVKYGLSGRYALESGSRVYGAARLISSATWGDGDAAGFTTGSERRTNFEDAYVGWKSGNMVSALGKDGLDISAGKQTYTLGNGFLIYGDALNFGNGFDQIAPRSLDRGGAYYLAARQSFDRTAILRMGQSTNLRGDIFWLHSDNKAQAKMELAGLNVEYEKSRYAKLGLTYVRGLSVDRQLAEFLGYTHRDGQDTFSISASGSAGVEHLLLAGDYVHQDNGSAGTDHAWFLEAAWAFADAPWKPDIGARYSSFSSGFDPLFYGLRIGYGTWYQGEVAGNYAGPFNTNAGISHLFLNAKPLPSLTLGVLFFDFQTKDKDFENLDAREWDIYVEWKVNDHFTASPLIGFYTPDKSAGQGGVQLGYNDTNIYAQMIVAMAF